VLCETSWAIVEVKMKLKELLSFLVILVIQSSAKSNTRKCGTSVVGGGNLSGGQDTKRHSWPWLVALQYQRHENFGQFFCAGSLVSAKHVLSGGKTFS
jgi:secreted trypsin-like serine protease